MTIEAFAFVCVPPANVCNVTAAALEWFLTVKMSPAEAVIITIPELGCVPAPEPYILPATIVPFCVIAN